MLFLLALTIGTAVAEGVQSGGTVSATARVGISGCTDDPAACRWLSFQDAAVFSPWVIAKPDSRVQAKAQVDFRLHGPTSASSAEDAQTTDLLQPWSLRVKDAWLAAQTDHLDLSMGAQRVAWGVANGISVVDNVYPLDLENPTKFDRRLSTLSAVTTAHSGNLSLAMIAVPFFVPAALPQIDVSLLEGASDVFSEDGLTIGSVQTNAQVPVDTLSQTAVAAQLRWTPPAVDLALSWYHGTDSLPQVDGNVLLIGYQSDSEKVDVGVPLTYPRVDIGGLTARGALPGDLTGWVEAAVVLPERTEAEPSRAQLQSLVQLGTIDEIPDPAPRIITQDGDPYARWIVGLERGFGPARITVQWLHGFLTERRARDLRDYGLISLQLGLSDTVRLTQDGASDLDGWLSDTTMSWLHADALELSAGATIVGGPEHSAFGGLKMASGARIQAKMVY